MKLWRREREQPVEPDPELEHRIADVLHRHATYRGRDSVLYAYKAEARQRQQQRAGKKTPPTKDLKESCSSDTQAAAARHPQAEIVSTPAPFVRAVPSVAPAPVPAKKTEADFERERFEAFEILAGNGHRLAERWQEVREYEEEPPPPEYVW